MYLYNTLLKLIKNVNTVYTVISYYSPVMGTTTILVSNEGLYYGEMLYHSLINTNQFSKHVTGLWYNPYNKGMQIYIEVDDKINIPY